MRKNILVYIMAIVVIILGVLWGYKLKEEVSIVKLNFEEIKGLLFGIQNEIKLKDTELKDVEINDSLSEYSINLEINGKNYVFDCSKLIIEKDIEELNAEFNTNIILQKNENIIVKINGKEVDHTFNLKINSLSKDNKIPVEIINKNTLDKRLYFINTLPSDFPKYYVMGKSDFDGDYYGTILNDANPANRKSGFIFKMNDIGNILYYKKYDTCVIDFKKVYIDNGEIRYTFYEQDNNKYFYENIGYAPCNLVIMDEKYNILKKVALKGFGEIPEGFPTESHDSILLDDNHYLVTSYFAKNVTNVPNIKNSKVIAAIIQEVKDGEVIWQWDSTNYPELYETSTEGNDFENKNSKFADYAHLNSIQIDPIDNNIICSFRHLDSIIKLDRITGKILWILGGKKDQFGLSDEQKFSHQHYARITNSRELTLFDNGNKNNQSRVLKFKIDEENKKILEYTNYTLENRFSPAAGSAELLDQDYFLVGWGIGDFSKLENATEIDFSKNEKVWQLIFEGNVQTYRILKIK